MGTDSTPTTKDIVRDNFTPVVRAFEGLNPCTDANVHSSIHCACPTGQTVRARLMAAGIDQCPVCRTKIAAIDTSIPVA